MGIFGGAVSENSLINFTDVFYDTYPGTKLPTKIAKLAMSLNIAVVVPLAIWPYRSAVCSVIARSQAGCTGPAVGSDMASDLLFNSVTIISIAIVTVLAIFIPSVKIP